MNANTLQIYSEFINGNFVRRQSTSLTLEILERLLNLRLTDPWYRIKVDASNSGTARFCFTLFRRDGSYTMRFAEVKNFRNWRPDGILNDEVVFIENMISRFACLSDILTSE